MYNVYENKEKGQVKQVNNLGQKLKEKREDMQLSRKELGERIDVSQYIIAQYEEETCDFSASILTKIMDELEMDFWEVCSDTGIILTPEEPSEFSKMLAKEAEKCARKIEINLHSSDAKYTLLRESSKEELIDYCIKLNDDLNVVGVIDEIFSHEEENMSPLENISRYLEEQEVKEKIYLDIRKAVLNTINLKLEEVERKYGKNKNKQISKSYNDNVIKLDFGSKDR
ncbi:hypothetical protein QX51_14780 [Terrisporobacter othiniensis]|uniref:HTH cro/C1-type domain-containing protein n=1 Tax=Terrisporobacter othiniensis TaxID=1577792 RepID=A0A0B3VUQ3_9FIRM|nr:hypothetical protein QX51_14780 [Terrisporobacter othiniensis]